MNVFWTEPALTRREESLDYIEAENAPAAQRMEVRVVDTIRMLADHPLAGRAGRIASTRQFAVPQSPFLIVYKVDRDRDVLTIVAVFDGRRRWPKAFPRE
ncbi:MAG: type II toxin-antitoxin system RelE/ParE family toxin [Acidobacteriaceae bacterium]